MDTLDSKLYQSLLEGGFIPEKQLKEVASEAEQGGKSLYLTLLERDLMPDENLGQLMADSVKLPFISLSKISIDEKVLKIIPDMVARKHQAIAFGQDKDGIKVATPLPFQDEFFALLEKKTGERVKVYFATERDVHDVLRLYKKDIQKTLDELLNDQVDAASREEGEAPITKIVDLLIEDAYENKTSDIHVEPRTDDSLVRFRIDGVLHDVVKLPRGVHDQVVTRVKVLSKLRTDEHLSAQDGKLRVKLPEEELDVRVSIVPIVQGEKVVMRLLSSRSRQFSLTDLGMSQADLKKVRDGFNQPYGMVLSTGPTGSGKTTTIYAILKILNTRDKNIDTIEDPVEYEIGGINQIQVNPKTNLTFADGLRAILRQDPDIIFVGEIRDDETADIAINSSLTGHLVLSTLHTNDAATTLPRLIDMGVEPFLVASTVRVVIGQRLVRKICPKCNVSYTEDRARLAERLPKQQVQAHFGKGGEIRLYHGKGCGVCHGTGYVGRVGIFEVLSISPRVQELIVQKADSDQVKLQAVKEGMSTMLDDGLEKVGQGITTIEEILRVTKE